VSRQVTRTAAVLGAAALLFAATSCTSHTGCAVGASCNVRSASPTASSPDRSSSGAPAPAGISSAEWRDLPPAPGGARQEVAAATVGGKVYVVGGLLADQTATARAEAYDPVTRTWTTAPPLPIELHHPMAAGFRGRLYVLGGIMQRLGGPDSTRVFVLEGSRWAAAPALHRPRGAGAAVVVNDRIVVVGGIDGANEVAPVEIFDGSSWRDGAPMPSPLDHVGAATDGRYVYVAGGRRNGHHYGTFQRYDPVTDSWKRLPNMPTARSGLGVAFAQSSVIAFGGEGSRMFPETEAFVVTSEKWMRLPHMGVPRHGLGVAAIGPAVYAMVGGRAVGVAPSAACEELLLR